ncbi:Hypothetical predicted protein [Octopus vulgaris]|uniref:Uncharacterized protein n=1 Tax=Octopus vulgaris TaxID=6645 RepID=A0AA36BEM8_OCTVU|nr:Hypothetical predicted protein [Octopus vulgaris]
MSSYGLYSHQICGGQNMASCRAPTTGSYVPLPEESHCIAQLVFAQLRIVKVKFCEKDGQKARPYLLTI